MPSQSPDLQLITTTDAFLSLQPHWNALLHSTRHPSVFLTFEYLSTWWHTYARDCKLRILTAWKDGQLIGIAPFAVGPGGPGLARRCLRHLSYLGYHGSELSEYVDLLIAPGHEEDLTRRFTLFALEDLRNEWDVVHLHMVPSDSRSLASMLPLAESRGLCRTKTERIPAPYLPLPGSWEDLLQGKSKNFRKQFNNHWNRLHKQHRVEVLRAGTDLPIDEAFEVLLQLNSRRWGPDQQSFTTQKSRRFFHQLAHRFQDLGWLCFLILKIDGAFAGARFDFIYDGKLWNFQGGWNPDLAALSPGRMLLGYQMQWCIAQGIREYDFLAGDAEYKRAWATHERSLLSLEFPRPGSNRARIFLAARLLKDRVKRGHTPGSTAPAAAVAP